jgi:hypothetical protein
LTNGIASNQKASANQRKQFPESRVNAQNGRKSLISTICKELKKLNPKEQII